MQIEGVPEFGAVAAPTGADKLQANKEMFLNLLMAQLKNQDPLSPPDADKFTEQMTQFGQLEQLFTVNNTLEKFLATQTMGQNAQLASMIGKTVEIPGSSLKISEDGSASEVGWSVGDGASSVRVDIRNGKGQLVRTVEVDGLNGAGNYFGSFDGKDAAGKPLASGIYQFDVTAFSANGQALSASPLTRGIVERISFDQGGALLRVAGEEVPLQSVRAIANS